MFFLFIFEVLSSQIFSFYLPEVYVDACGI